VDSHRERFESLAEIAEVAAVASAGERLSPSEILDTLRRRYGVRRVLVEGGPSLVGDLLAADAVDQIFLTISPRVVGGDERTIAGALAWISPPRGLSLVSAAAEAGFLFLRYEVRR
jgi:5-amino-6-(5-phosphoribosylamino)uracil reductase